MKEAIVTCALLLASGPAWSGAMADLEGAALMDGAGHWADASGTGLVQNLTFSSKMEAPAAARAEIKADAAAHRPAARQGFVSGIDFGALGILLLLAFLVLLPFGL